MEKPNTYSQLDFTGIFIYSLLHGISDAIDEIDYKKQFVNLTKEMRSAAETLGHKTGNVLVKELISNFHKQSVEAFAGIKKIYSETFVQLAMQSLNKQAVTPPVQDKDEDEDVFKNHEI